MDKNEVIRTVKKMMDAPSCCAELKAAAQTWLDAVGTAEEEAAAKVLSQEIREDITPIDDLIALCESEEGKKMFGEENAANMAKTARESKAQGGTHCICDACQAGVALLAAGAF